MKRLYLCLIFILITSYAYAGGLNVPVYGVGNPLENIKSINFDLEFTDECEEGIAYWNADDATLNIGITGNVCLQVGQEQLVRVINKSGGDIDNGEVVYISNSLGIRPTIEKADASSSDTSDDTLGIVTEDISDNGNGYVTSFGLVRDVDTSSFTAGDELYLSTTAGAITNTAPTTPDHYVHVGHAMNSHATEGVILVHIDTGGHIEDLHDVLISSAIANDTLVYNGTYWENKQPSYAAFEYAVHDKLEASSVTVYNGTIASGDVTNTTTVDQVYLQVTESGQFLIDYTFTGLTLDPASVNLVGRYEGNPAHNVKIKAWNYTTSAYVDLTADADDFPSSSTDSDFRFEFPDLINYTSGGEAKVRIEHESAAVGSHNFYADFIDIELATVEVVNAGTFYLINSATAGPSSNVTVDVDAGSFTIVDPGDYEIHVVTSFSGSSNTKVDMHLFINDVNQHISGLARTLGDGGEFGSAAADGIVSLSASDVLTIKASATTSGKFITIDHYNFSINKLN